MCEIYDDGPSISASSSTWRQARKAHACFCCSKTIAIGDRYRYESWVSDGNPGSQKTCESCHYDINAFGEAHNYWPVSEDFIGRLEDCIADGDEESETKWKPMLARIQARRSAVAA